MERVQLTENISFSRMVQGFWRLAEWDMSKEEILSFTEQCIELGITTFDHADIYGDYTCEALFGEVLKSKPSLRDSMQLVTKCGIKLLSEKYPKRTVKHYDTSKEHIIASVESSLQKIGTDYVDVLLIHRPDPFMDPAEVAEAFTKLRQEGKVLAFGVSNFLPSQFEMLSAYLDFPLVTNQIEISVMQLEHFANGTIEKCQEKRIHPMAWSPLSGGRLFSDRSRNTQFIKNDLSKVGKEIGAASFDQVMYAWLLAHPAGIIPINGSGKIERIRSAVKATKLSMNRHQWFEIYESAVGHEVP
ncbi:aldo/keto reductase [Ectobacillus polymachus]|uniref:aldo/keto reductase n=1 Tax=Ectobacillus polymachus TaxID=1508806 RepID=UPI003A84182E